MRYKMEFTSSIDNCNQDRDYDYEIQQWHNLGFETELINEDQNGLVIFKVAGTLSDKDIIKLLNRLNPTGVYLLSEAIRCYDKINNESIWDKFKNEFEEIDKYFKEKNFNIIRPKFETNGQRDVYDVVTPGRKGITNTQLIPALKSLIKEENIEDIKIIQEEIYDLYESSLKYLSKKQREYLNSINEPTD